MKKYIISFKEAEVILKSPKSLDLRKDRYHEPLCTE